MSDNNIRISIIIPCYNQGQYIDEAIKSVEEYKYNDYEIIIINDGSTDEFTNKHLLELKDKGYHVLFQENQGLSSTRNNGIRLAKGKYILPLDADNKIKAEYIIKAIEILDGNSSISIVYSDRQLFGNSNELKRVGELNVAKIIRENYIDACAIFRKTIWTEIGGYDETMLIGLEDWDFWLSSIEKGFRFFYVPEPLFSYRVVDNSMIHQLYINPSLDTLIKSIYIKHSLLMKDEFIEEIFRQKNEINKLNLELNLVKQSKAYRIGKFILKPFSKLKNRLNA